MRKTLHYLTQLDGWKVCWRSYQEQWFDSCGPFKDAVISIMATLAEQERTIISERTLAALARVRKAGKVLGRPRPEINLARVHKLQGEGMGLRGIAADAGVAVNTLRAVLAAGGAR